MLNLKDKGLNKKIKLVVTILFALFIIYQGSWYLKTFEEWDSLRRMLLISFLPAVLVSGIIFYVFKKRKNGLIFILGTIFSIIMYYVFCSLWLIIIFSISTFLLLFE